MSARIENWYLDGRLNRIRLEIATGNDEDGYTAIGSSWMSLITRVRLKCGDVVLDSDIDAGVFDFTTEAADSILRMDLGKGGAVLADFGSVDSSIPVKARLDIFHGADNAVLSHSSEQSGLRFWLWPAYS